MKFMRVKLGMVNVNFTRAEDCECEYMSTDHCECKFIRTELVNVNFMRAEF